MKHAIIVLVIISVGFTCLESPAYSQDTTWFRPIYQTSTMGTTGTWIDINLDGKPDLSFQTAQNQHLLLINNGDGTFSDSSKQYGVGGDYFFGGSAVGDIDGDGWQDFFVSSRDNTGNATGPCQLLMNSRGRSLVDIALQVGLQRGGTGETAILFDYDGDGDLDLFLLFNHTVGLGAYLYRNDGSKFTEVLDQTGLPRHGWFEGAQAVDFNNDGFVDLAFGGHLYLNNGNGTFTDASNGVWTCADEGLCFADLDNDGNLDLVHNPSIEGTYKLAVFRNDQGWLHYVRDNGGLSDSLVSNHWGITTVDVDNDGLTDILVGGYSDSGHPSGPFLALKNLGGFKFVDYTRQWNLEFAESQKYSDLVGQADYDNDGHMDLFIQGQRAGVKVWHNESTDSRYLNVRVAGSSGQLNQFGARIFLRGTGDRPGYVRTDFVGSGPGYQVKGQYDNHFGVPPDSAVDVEVIFPSAENAVIRVDKNVNPALSGIIPARLGNNAVARTVEVRRNGDVVLGGVLYKAVLPTTVTLAYPANTGVLFPSVDSLVSLSWTAFPGASKYDIQVSDLSRFDTSSVVSISTSGTDTTVAIHGKGRIYWRVRALFGAEQSAWSDPSCVIIDTTAIPYKRLDLNHSPVFVIQPDTIAREDSTYAATAFAADADSADRSDHVHYRWVKEIPWLTLDASTGSLRGIPSAGQVGQSIGIIEASDGRGGVSRSSVKLNIIHTNHSPHLLDIPMLQASEDAPCESIAHAVDVDTLFGDVLRYHLNMAPAWLSIDTVSGRIAGTPRAADVGDSSFDVQVSDNHGGTAVANVRIHVNHANHKPQFDASHLWSISAQEDSLLSVKIHATDPDSKTFGDYVLYSLLSAPHWLGIDSMSGVLHGSPGLKDGDTAVSVLATDGLLSDTLTLSVSVVHPPHPPVALGIPPVELSHGEVTQVPLTSYFKDQENPLSSLKWSLKTSTTDMRLSNADTSGSGASYPFLPDTANNGVGSSGIRVVMRLVGQRGYRDSLIARIDSATMALRCRPPVTLGGFQTAVVISAMSSSSIGAKDTVLIVVPTSTVPPKITGGMALSFDEDDSVRVSPSALLRYVVAPNDPDSALHWSIRSDGIILVSSDTTGIVLRSRRNWNGVDSVRLVVANDRGLGDSIMMSVRVRPVNDPPASTTISRLAFEEDSCITVSLDTLVIDPDNGAREITWGIGNSPQGITLFRRSGLDTIRVPISDSRMPSPSGTLVCTLDSSGTRLRLTASRRFFGSSIAFYLKAIDTGGLSCIDSLKLDIRQRNYPPLLASPSILTMKEDAGTSISLRSIYHLLIDPDDSASTHRWCVRNGRHVHPVVVDSTIVFSADSLWFGADTLTLVATDPGGLSDSTQWIMNVQWVNHPPRFERLPDTLATMNVRYRWRPVVHDPDPNDVEIVTIENGPDWLGVDTTGTLSGVAHKSGSWTVAVAVHDRSGRPIRSHSCSNR